MTMELRLPSFWVCLVVACLATSPVVSAQNPREITRFCESKDMPVTLAVNAPAELRSISFFSSSNNEGSLGDMILANTGDKPIIHAVVVTDFLDRDGTRLLTMPFFFRDDTRLDEEMKNNFREETDWMPPGLAARRTGITHGVLSHAIRPRESWEIAGISDILLTTCPARVRVTLLASHYSDGTVFVDSSPDLHLEPVIDMSWAINSEWGALRFSLHESPVAPGSDVLAKLRIAADGCPIVQATDKDSAITSWLQQVVSSLSFVPAMDSGRNRDKRCHSSNTTFEIPNQTIDGRRVSCLRLFSFSQLSRATNSIRFLCQNRISGRTWRSCS